MLSQSATTSIIPVRDVARARDFYEAKLGLVPDGETTDGGFAFRTGDQHLISLLPDPDGMPTGRTTLSFEVADLPAEVEALESAGVAFEDYDGPGIATVDHIATFEGEQAAWFTDSEGNVLCLHTPTP